MITDNLDSNHNRFTSISLVEPSNLQRAYCSTANGTLRRNAYIKIYGYDYEEKGNPVSPNITPHAPNITYDITTDVERIYLKEGDSKNEIGLSYNVRVSGGHLLIRKNRTISYLWYNCGWYLDII